MPELPEVESIRLALKDLVIGKEVRSTDTRLRRIVRRGDLDWMIGRTITSIIRCGKYLWFTTDDKEILYVHMRMSGTLLWLDERSEYPDYVRAEIGFDDGRMVYRDIRTLGGLWVDRNGEPPWRKLGVDPLEDDFEPVLLGKLLKKRRSPIKTVLLDQSLVAGIGNIYSVEALFLAGIDPRRPAADLSTPEVEKLHSAILDRLTTAIANRGTTFRDFRLSDGRSGSFQDFLKVYSKENQPCTRCGRPIRRIVQSQRSTFFCPHCQV